MGIFGSLFGSLNKSYKLKKLESIFRSFNSGDKAVKDRGEALEKIIDLCEADTNIVTVMEEYQATRETLRELYYELIMNSLGIWKRGHFIAASALAYPQTLSYCLKAMKNDNINSDEVTFALYKYFDESKTSID